MKIFCITHKPLNSLHKIGLTPAGVGKNKFPQNYTIENSGDNIANKNFCYSETSFHYWIWKNYLPKLTKDEWIGTCQYRRYFVKKSFGEKIQYDNRQQGLLDLKNVEELRSILQLNPEAEWEKYDVVLCKPWSVANVKKMKLIKRGFRSLIKDPSIFYNKKKQTIKLHFDMSHGYGNLEKAASLLPDKDKDDFLKYVSTKTWLIGHCIFISKNKELMNLFYNDLFSWLSKCEEVFGFKSTSYDTKRIYSFLTERYMPYWFEKYSKVITWPWIFFDISKFEN
tara:strand:+ start:470 stop:1312 length:843 start_codon:yes stop_codon:yes gene_type:complete